MAHRATFGDRKEFRLKAELATWAASAWMWGCEDESCEGESGQLGSIVEACRWSDELYGQDNPVTGGPNIIGGCHGVVCGACCSCLCGSPDESEE
jgi:hypothetical protein